MPDQAEQLDLLKAALADRYRIEHELGRGGMATVYLADDLKLERKVAVKVLHPELAVALGSERFQREIRFTARLEHPHILTVHDSGEAHGFLYYVMPYVEGESLRERLNREKQLPIDDAIQITRELADALDCAHRHDVIHRDVKPENILLTAGHARVADFGIARAITAAGGEQLTETGLAIGTPSYMSPEQAEGKHVDHRSDIFSTGVILYEMLTGKRPFCGDSAVAVLFSILNETPAPVTQIHPDLPHDLERIIKRCLAKDVEGRYQTANDVRSDLQQLKRELDSGTVDRTSARLTRRQTFGIAIGAGLALFAVGAVVYYLQHRSPSRRTSWSIRPLTSFTGSEAAGTWSPDGSFVAYSHTGSGSMDIFVMSTGGGDPVRLTDDPADEVLPRWSPDGRYLAFLSDRGSGSNVYLIPSLGGAERKLVETNLPYPERFDDVWGALGAQPWSPDARELLFSRLQATGETAVWKVNRATGEEAQLTQPRRGESDLYASWSFDGNWIAFVRLQGGVGSLWLLPAEGGEARVLLGEPYEDTQPAWSTDNRRLVFTSNRSGQVSLWEIEVSSGQLRHLTTGPWDWNPNVASNGRIIFDRFRDRADLYWTQIGGAAEEQLTFNNSDNYAPRFSPDGDKIVFHSNRTGNDEIWLLDVETRVERQLTEHPASDVLPDWSPDGKEIAFFSNREGEFQLWVMETEGGPPRRLTEQPISVLGLGCSALRIAPRWSPDGEAIGYIAPSPEGVGLWVVDRDGKNTRSYLTDVLRFDWYQDSRHVVYTRMAGNGSGAREMRVVDLETGEETTLHKGLHVELTVAANGRAASYVEALSHYAQALYLLPLAPPRSMGGLPGPTGEPQVLSRGTGHWHVHNGGWSQDGTRIVYTRTTDESDLYVIENYK